MKQRKMIAVCAASDRKYRKFYQDCQECAELDAMNAAVNQRLKEQETREKEREQMEAYRRQQYRKKIDAWMKAMTASAIFLTSAFILSILACAGFIGWWFMVITLGVLGIVCAFFAGCYWCEFKQ